MEEIDSKMRCVYRLYNEYKYGKSKKNKKKIKKLVGSYFNKNVDVDDVFSNINLQLLNLRYNKINKKGNKKGGSYWPIKPRDSTAVTNKGEFWDIPRHLTGVAINIGATVVDSIRLTNALFRIPGEFSNIVNKPNEPIPSDSKVGKFFDEYMGK